MTEQDLINGIIKKSTSAWFETYGRIFGKDRAAGLQKPKANYLQKKVQRVVDKMNDDGLPVRVIILKPRQKGSTTYGAALDYTMLRRSPCSAVVIGGQMSQVDEAWQMLQTYSKADRFNWSNTGEINSKAGSWSNGSKLIKETAGDAVAGVGGTHQCLHCFEVARWAEHGVSNSAEVLTNIMQCVPLLPGTLINLESTAEGQSGAYYTHWCSAIDAEDFLSGAVELKPGSFVRCFAAWFQFDDSAMRLTEAQREEVKRTLDGESWYEGEQELIDQYGHTGDDGVLRLGDVVEDYDLYEQLAWRRWSIEVQCKKDKTKFERDSPHSWKTAFQKSGNQRFSTAGLAAIRRKAERITPMTGILEEAKEGRISFRPLPENEAQVVIFEKPTAGFAYLMGIDPMTGATQAGGVDPDYHAVFVMRKGYYDKNGKWHPPATAARIVQCRWDLDILTPVAFRLAQFYGTRSGCMIVVEMNQDKGITELLKQQSANLYRREMFNKTEQTTTKAYGFLTNEKTRENLIEGLAGAIRNHDEIGNGVDIYCTTTLDECENFVRKRNGRSEAAEGWHDDSVFGIALPLHVIEHATTYYAPRTLSGAWFTPPDLRNQSNQGAQAGAFS